MVLLRFQSLPPFLLFSLPFCLPVKPFLMFLFPFTLSLFNPIDRCLPPFFEAFAQPAMSAAAKKGAIWAVERGPAVRLRAGFTGASVAG